MNGIHILSTVPSCLGGRRFSPQFFEVESYILSALLWRQLNGPIRLYTDDVGLEFLTSRGLESIWDSIDTNTLSAIPKSINQIEFWAGAKLYALRAENAPVAMVDTDLFIWKDISSYCKGRKLVTLHREDLIECYPPIEGNLKPTSISQSINVYLEDNRALSLLLYILERGGIEASQYINPVDINLGWTNYLQLYEKEIPEFRNSLIILDNDVKSKPNFKAKKHIVMDANNILFMPVDVEAGIYKMLRNHENYSMFEAKLKEKHIAMSYDVCFRDYVNDECSDSNEYKQWFKYVEQSIKDVNLLFDVWYTIYREDAIDFIEEFINTYNVLAEEQELDYLIPSSFDNLDDTINSDTKVENKPKIGRLF